ncbi:ATP-dependent helicase HrpB [Sansalvadorimonas sp. 2012CJ34-2]|uniref:ATP-dependent helicase HrpB n=1 Tax=Parendozoicomonas callyspongiae TaxID=2942213 RepID=A0ABT0PCK4_9GAMM|nr:ATP-dependent helicase HrpB [Sansalvadorimonas sp. 2012CJ34-2]MCL6269112.1 ATP-dependent helicase HrpB [Sansalvadorimonas sp. 2012CJ34-2]
MSVSDLPVTNMLSKLKNTLARNDRVLLQAPPGAGKTTLVPLDILKNAEWLAGQKILLLEPRKLAARSVSRRMAELLGEKVGQTIGWRMQLDTRVSKQTRIEVVTEGVLTRMLQSDPSLEGVGLIIFDEFHERSLQADLGLTLALQSQEGYREEDNPLKILVMSATLATEEMADFLQCPVITSEGRSFPVTAHYRDSAFDRHNRRELIQNCASTIQQALNHHDGSLLAFLPGSGEIRQIEELLQDSLPANTTLHTLYGDLSKEAQDKAIQPCPEGQRKVVLATAIAESSLTIEGVHIVVDAGLMRVPRFDPRSGMSRLDTIRVSASSAEQRAGRAGRLAAGHCYRLWTESEQKQLIPFSKPEILEADLASVALELLGWGISDISELDWLTQPPPASLSQAFDLLESLGALQKHSDDRRQITRHGEAMCQLGLHPRLAHMILIARDRQLSRLAGLLCVLLSERDPLSGIRDAGVDIGLRLAFLESQKLPGFHIPKSTSQRFRQLTTRWLQRLGNPKRCIYTNDDVALLLACAYPDRVARRRCQDGRYLLSGGQGVSFRSAEPLSASEFLVIPETGGHSSQREAIVFLACEITLETIEELFTDQIEEHETVCWDKRQKSVQANLTETFGALTLTSNPIQKPDPEIIAKGLLQGIRETGLHTLPWDKESEAFRNRVNCLYTFDTSWPDLSEQALLDNLEEWLLPFVDGFTRLDHLKKLNLLQCLQAQLDWSRLQELENEAPEKLEVPSGSKIRIDYSNPAEPILGVKLQELFGMLDTPRLAYGKLPLTIELLSPAQRPVQKTHDLKSFWSNTYIEVKKDLKGRYPKHYWPEDPMTAVATRFVRPR